MDGNAPDAIIENLNSGTNRDMIQNETRTEFFECVCGTDEHTLKFKLDVHDPDDVDLYLSVFLNQYRGFFKRLWISIKYLFGYKCKDGHWDCSMLEVEDADRLIILLRKYKKLSVEK